jgi:biopolymer transport protein ExbB
MGLMEKGLSWISLCIAMAPMMGFMGTVIGMIGAFDAIEAAGDISPSLVAGGIKVAPFDYSIWSYRSDDTSSVLQLFPC